MANMSLRKLREDADDLTTQAGLGKLDRGYAKQSREGMPGYIGRTAAAYASTAAADRSAGSRGLADPASGSQQRQENPWQEWQQRRPWQQRQQWEEQQWQPEEPQWQERPWQEQQWSPGAASSSRDSWRR